MPGKMSNCQCWPSNAKCFAGTFGIVVLLLVLAISGCEQSGPVSESEKTIMRLYTSVPLRDVQEVKRAFEKDHPAIQLEITRSGTIKTMQRIADEAADGKVAADVIWVSDFSNAEQLKRNGLLLKYQSPEAAGVYPLFQDPEGYYTGSRLLNMIIVYNPRYVSDPPKSYRDLLESRWRGRLGIVNPATSGSSFYTLGSLLLNPEYGEDFLKELLDNRTVFISNNRTLVEKVAGGELCIGVAIDFIARKLRSQYPELPLNYIYPVDGTVVVPSPIGISRDSVNLAAAKTFIDWVLSRRGQTVLSSLLGIVPVRPDVEAPPGMVTLSTLRVMRSNAREIAEQHERIRATLDVISKPAPLTSCEPE